MITNPDNLIDYIVKTGDFIDLFEPRNFNTEYVSAEDVRMWGQTDNGTEFSFTQTLKGFYETCRKIDDLVPNYFAFAGAFSSKLTVVLTVIDRGTNLIHSIHGSYTPADELCCELYVNEKMDAVTHTFRAPTGLPPSEIINKPISTFGY